MGDYTDRFKDTADDRPLAPWLTNETHAMTDEELRATVDALPDLLTRGNVLMSGSTADGSIEVRDCDVWINTRTGERFVVTAEATSSTPPKFAPLDD
jgi:hypothetical protein